MLMTKWELTAEAYELFLSWLDPEREAAALRYEQIRKRLINFFNFRGCPVSEDLADEAINRVIRRAPQLIESYVGDRTPYFYTVAHHLHLEYMRKQQPADITSDIPDRPQRKDDDDEEAMECLDRCLGRLQQGDRDLVLRYYDNERRGKIEDRRRLADQLGISLNNLRIRMHRLRGGLEGCVKECLGAV